MSKETHIKARDIQNNPFETFKELHPEVFETDDEVRIKMEFLKFLMSLRPVEGVRNERK